MSYSAIDIGSNSWTPGGGSSAGYTQLVIDNPANASGVLNVIQVYAWASQTIKIGTFSGSGTSWDDRDYESLSVTSGSKQTFTGVNVDVSSGDVLGEYHASDSGVGIADGTQNSVYILEDTFGQGSHTYSAWTAAVFSFYATGVTVPDAPTDVAATDNLSDKITIAWTAGTGETDGHRVYRDTVDVSGVVAHGTATYDDVPAAGTYSYTVKAINAAGLSAASSANEGTRTGGGATLPLKNVFNRPFRGVFR